MCELIHYELTLFCVCIVFVQSERLQKLQLEDLREFLQEQLAVSFFLPDDVVVEQLQAAMSELRSKKLDQPPPGAHVFSYFLSCIQPFLRCLLKYLLFSLVDVFSISFF